MPFISLLSILLFMLLPAQPQDSAVEWLGSTEIELGEINYQEPVSIRFPFRNVSDKPLTIDNVRTRCGCTSPNWSEVAVAPGDTSSILIVYDADKMGYFKEWVRVFFHKQRRPERLWIEGEVVN